MYHLTITATTVKILLLGNISDKMTVPIPKANKSIVCELLNKVDIVVPDDDHDDVAFEWEALIDNYQRRDSLEFDYTSEHFHVVVKKVENAAL